MSIGPNVVVIGAEAIPELAHRLLELDRTRRLEEAVDVTPEPEAEEVATDGPARNGRLSRFRVDAGAS